MFGWLKHLIVPVLTWLIPALAEELRKKDKKDPDD